MTWFPASWSNDFDIPRMFCQTGLSLSEAEQAKVRRDSLLRGIA